MSCVVKKEWRLEPLQDHIIFHHESCASTSSFQRFTHLPPAEAGFTLKTSSAKARFRTKGSVLPCQKLIRLDGMICQDCLGSVCRSIYLHNDFAKRKPIHLTRERCDPRSSIRSRVRPMVRPVKPESDLPRRSVHRPWSLKSGVGGLVRPLLKGPGSRLGTSCSEFGRSGPVSDSAFRLQKRSSHRFELMFSMFER